MPQTRFVSESHGDYEYCVEEGEKGPISYRTPLNSPSDAPDEPVRYEELPSESLKEAYSELEMAIQQGFI